MLQPPKALVGGQRDEGQLQEAFIRGKKGIFRERRLRKHAGFLSCFDSAVNLTVNDDGVVVNLLRADAAADAVCGEPGVVSTTVTSRGIRCLQVRFVPMGWG